ncbi:MAG: cupredoxin domain-containing protein [Patescibacteria group bacterium]|nr:cupredoxin domain-containing protein [Patescibacteria group bacterium]
MNKVYLFIILLVVLLGGLWFVSSRQSEEGLGLQNGQEVAQENNGDFELELENNGNLGEEMDNDSDNSVLEVGIDTSLDIDTSLNVSEVNITAFNFGYSSSEIRVKQGDLVRLRFVNEEGFHDWVLDEFNAATRQMQAGEEQTIEFIADRTGEFEFYCSVGQHRQMGMVGKLIVE